MNSFFTRLGTTSSAAVLCLVCSMAAAQDTTDEGKKIFTQTAVPQCALCHTLKHAGATGEVGPVLDELKPDAARVEKAVRNGIGQMPANTKLTDEQIKTVAKYVADVAGK